MKPKGIVVLWPGDVTPAKKPRDSRHLKDIGDPAWAELHELLLIWLKRHGIAGSHGTDYSLYNALDDERRRAHENFARQREHLRQLARETREARR